MPAAELGAERALQVVAAQTRSLRRLVTSIHYPQKRQSTRTGVKRKVKTQRLCPILVLKSCRDRSKSSEVYPSCKRCPERTVCEEVCSRVDDYGNVSH